MARLEFFFDCSSPWTYLAFHRIEAVAAEGGAELVWRPILVGGVFNTVNPSVYQQRANPTREKLRYYAKDLADWARSYELVIGSPSVFPVNSVRAMRAAGSAINPMRRRWSNPASAGIAMPGCAKQRGITVMPRPAFT